MNLQDVGQFHVLTGLLAVTLALTLANTVLLTGTYSSPSPPATTEQETQESFTLPTGTPDTYGSALGVSFDDVSPETPEQAQQIIQLMASKDRIELNQEQKQRYITILYEAKGGISCEYCCEARSVITAEGESACGCAHAAAMRGLTKYLLTEHRDMSNQEILEEVSKWKTRFFPDQTRTKAEALQGNGVEPTPVALSVNEYRGAGTDEGGWVGDC